jgi:hypothetical protein
MKKILLIFDGDHFSEGAFEFARRLNETERILVTGAFLPQVDYANLWSYADGTAAPLFIPLAEPEFSEAVAGNIERFKKECEKNDINYRVHKDFFDFAIPGAKKESRFADLAILGSEIFYENVGGSDLNEYLKVALHELECPALVVPEHFDYPQSNIIAFDASASSVYAMKQFAYLFPSFCNNKTLLVYVSEDLDPSFPDEANIMELAARHFSDLTLFKLDINPRKYFATWIKDKKSAMLVTGAYGRSAISQLFRKSFVSNVIREHKLPVFIAHPV